MLITPLTAMIDLMDKFLSLSMTIGMSTYRSIQNIFQYNSNDNKRTHPFALYLPPKPPYHGPTIPYFYQIRV